MLKLPFSRFAVVGIDQRGAGLRKAVRWLVVFALCVSAGACTASASSPSPAPPTRVETTDGRFHLTFEMPKTTWRGTEAIDGTATLSLAGEGSVTISGSSALFGFAFASADGTRHIVPIWQADCVPRTLEPGKPLTTSLDRSGDGWTTAELSDRLLHLPAGDWTITAVASFVEGTACSGERYTLNAAVLVHVSA